MALFADPYAPAEGQELFRLVALRAPEPPVGLLPRIALESPADPDGATTNGDAGDRVPAVNLVALRATPTVAGLARRRG